MPDVLGTVESFTSVTNERFFVSRGMQLRGLVGIFPLPFYSYCSLAADIGLCSIICSYHCIQHPCTDPFCFLTYVLGGMMS